MTKVPEHYLVRFLSTTSSNPEISFLVKTSEKRIDSEKVLGSSQNMKGEIVRSIEWNSTISSFLGRWQNLPKSQNYIENIQDNSFELKENFIHEEECTWITIK